MAGSARPSPPTITDGQIRYHRLNLGRQPFQDVYHELLVAPWPRFVAWLWLAYLALNTVFATAYLMGGDCYGAGERTGPWTAFAFSIQTLTTIGYGSLGPTTPYADAVVTVESFVGLLGIALSSGLCFAKFGRPVARVAFARHPVLTRFHGRPCLMFRVANERNSRIVDVRVHAFALVDHLSPEGHMMRRFHPLAVERDHTPMLLMSWQIMSFVDGESPLAGLGDHDLPDLAAIIVTITGIDAAFMQTVYSQHTYRPEDLRRNHRFDDMMTTHEGLIAIDHAKLHETIPEG